MKLSTVLSLILLTNNLNQIVLIKTQSNANPKDIFCEDVCTDGRNCLTNEWFVCKWNQILNPKIVCCLRRNNDDKSVDSGKSFAISLQNNCANTRRHKHVSKRGFLSFLQNFLSGKGGNSDQYPWMVSVLIFGRHVCGGSIITDYFVVTAAHCLVPLFDSSVYSLRIGSKHLSEGQELSVSRIIKHELYFTSESYHDIAIIVTKSAINFDKRVDIVCLATSDMESNRLVGRTATVVGFGNNFYNGFLSKTLKQINAKIISNKECAQRYSIGDKHNIPIGIQECMVCTVTEGTDACQGDSGGPMTVTINGVYYLVGIVSFGRKCGSVDFPGVYTNVIYYRKWIFEQMLKHDRYYGNYQN